MNKLSLILFILLALVIQNSHQTLSLTSVLSFTVTVPISTFTLNVTKTVVSTKSVGKVTVTVTSVSNATCTSSTSTPISSCPASAAKGRSYFVELISPDRVVP